MSPGSAAILRPSAACGVLAVDLDDTLVQTDLLYETFWAGLARDWRQPFRALNGLRTGLAAAKRDLAEHAQLDVADLPYNQAVIDRIRAWRRDGGSVVLVTASDQRLADRVAKHLGLFARAHGSDGVQNLKGAHKAAFLTEQFGEGGFVYVGDSASDLQVWEKAGGVIAVGVGSGLRRRIGALNLPAEFIDRPDRTIAAVFEAMRPHQWLKNILVFVPMVADQSFDTRSLIVSVIAFVAMCLVASGGYMLNDLLDLTDDRTHPRKCKRPMASGRMPVQAGTALVPSLLAIGLSLAFLVGNTLAVVILTYFVLTTAYSLKLKQYALIDVFLLAVLYTSRIVVGGVAIWVELSIWILAFSTFFFLSLAAVKRQAELIEAETVGTRERTRRGYQVEDRSMVTQMAVSAGYASVLVLALYLNEPDVQNRYGAPHILWLVCPLLLYWVTRMVLKAGRGQMHDDPLVYAVQSRTSRMVLATVIVLVILAIFL